MQLPDVFAKTAILSVAIRFFEHFIVKNFFKFRKSVCILVQNVPRDISFYYSHAEISKM